MPKPIVVLESPYAASPLGSVEDHVKYARRCLLDSLRRGEAPVASHLLYTQVLDDLKPEERHLGIEAGLSFLKAADRQVFYIDFGWSLGMLAARDRGKKLGVHCDIRSLGID